jgi:hypothetical protein
MKPIPDSQIEKRLELELKLQEDIRELNTFKEGVENSNNVTQKLVH